MKRMRLSWRLFAAAVMGALTACTTHIDPNRMVVKDLPSTAPFPSALVGAMCLDTVTGSPASEPAITTASFVPDFRAALERSLASQGLLARDGCRFRIDADLAALVRVWRSNSVLARSFVAYKVTAADGTTAFWTPVEITENDPFLLNALFSPTGFLRAGENALHDNIAEFLQRLRTVKL